MKRCFNLLMSTVLIGVMFLGCEPADDFVPENDANLLTATTGEDPVYHGLPDYFTEELKQYESVEINEDSYIVEFKEREVQGRDGNFTTTFHYTVTGLNKPPALDSFFLEIPECAGTLLSYTPTQSAIVEAGYIKWNSSVPADESRDYSITFKGEVPLGIVNNRVVRGSKIEKKPILGPCQGVYKLSGNVFIDANEDRIKQSSESGISSEVTLFNKAADKEVTIKTSASGAYFIFVLNGDFMKQDGDYEISVAEDLMKDGYYTALSETIIYFNDVMENSSNNNFAFRANSSKMVGDLESGRLTVNTKPTKYWIDQIRHAGKKNSVFTNMEELNQVLLQVEEKHLPRPFDLGTDKRQTALDILTRPIKTELDRFLQQLLTAELNIISGRGAYENTVDNQLEKFNEALLIYSEAQACRAMSFCKDTDTDNISTKEVTVKAVRSSDSDLLTAFNGSGGLGG